MDVCEVAVRMCSSVCHLFHLSVAVIIRRIYTCVFVLDSHVENLGLGNIPVIVNPTAREQHFVSDVKLLGLGSTLHYFEVVCLSVRCKPKFSAVT